MSLYCQEQRIAGAMGWREGVLIQGVGVLIQAGVDSGRGEGVVVFF